MGVVRSAGVLAMEAREVLAALTGSDLTRLTDGEITELVVLTSEVAKLAEAAHVAAAGRLDVARAWEGNGARSAAAWIAWECHQSHGRSATALKCARLLRDLPGTEVAFLAGRLTVDHVRLLAMARRANPDAFAADETKLVGLAERLLFRGFQVGITYWIHANDPDGAEADAVSRYDSRQVDCSETFEGMVVIDALLDPMTGAIVARELHRLEQELFEADWADARERCGAAAVAADLRRTPSSVAPTRCGSWPSAPQPSPRGPPNLACCSTSSPATSPWSGCASCPTAPSSPPARSSRCSTVPTSPG